jgi:hypothetical protein
MQKEVELLFVEKHKKEYALIEMLLEIDSYYL